MLGDADGQTWMLSPVTPDTLVPQDHPIRPIRAVVDRGLERLSPTFKAMYSRLGRPSIPPEHLLKGMLLMSFYSIRSERQLCERLQYDLLFKWFLGLNIAERVFDHSTFSKNRERLLNHDVTRQFFAAVRDEAQRRELLSDDHFTVDGTLLDAWASMKSVHLRDGGDEPPVAGKNPEVDFRGERRRNETHVSRTDPQARLAKKARGEAARLAYSGHVLMENRNGLVTDILITEAAGRAEREAALRMLDRQERRQRRKRITLGADKGYDTQDFIADLRKRNVTPHVAQNESGRRSAIDGRTTSWGGYKVSQRLRKRVEEIFGWIKTVGGGRKLRFIGLARNQLWAEMTAAAYNIVRIVRLEPALNAA
jgi:transposase